MLSLAYAGSAPQTPQRPQQPRPAPAPTRPPHLRVVEPPHPLPEILRNRDPDFLRKIYPAVTALVDLYYRAELEGTENLSDSRSMLVSTHNGGMAMPELWCLSVAFWRRFGIETPAYGLMHKAGFKVPGLGPALTRMGAVPASQRNGRIALREGFPILVCPGGDEDSLKPYRQRHQIMFGNRRGFIRLAIREQVPIIPVVSVGAHETMIVLNEGRRTAQVLGLTKLFRIKRAPLTLSLPFGITPAGLGSIPFPTKVRLRVLPRIELDEPVWAAEDDERVDLCFEHVRNVMQRGLDKLAAQRHFPFFG